MKPELLPTSSSPQAGSHFDTAAATLLTPSGLDVPALQGVLGNIMSHQVDYADLYFQYSRAESWGLEEGQVKSGNFSIDQGVGVRAVSGEKTAFAYSDDIHLPALQQAANATRAIAALGSEQTGAHAGQAVKHSQAPQLYIPHDPIASLSAEAKVQLLERLEGFARKLDPRISQVMASIAGEYEVVMVARHDGVMAADVRPLVRLSVQVIAEANGRREQGSAGGGGRFDYSYFTDEVLQNYAREAVHQALTNLDARPAPAGSMTVVLGAGWPGILLHEAIGHGLEGDFNRKGSSAFAGRIGQRVASPGVTVVDDGTIADRRGSLNVDDEGNPTQRTVLIEDGILRGYIQDSLNARLMDMPVTGNARRESYAHIPMPRMTNTHMLNGSMAPEEIIRSVKKGLYAVNFGGGQVDITSGKFVFSAAEAWMIEDGKLTYPVKGATLIGNGPDVLTRVSMIG
ncbi:MAG TPA: metalloprotease TldD, partial [Methylophilaceae bacterium]|nr:metalloprotease TldD [Methylophilaceae bacterium]